MHDRDLLLLLERLERLAIVLDELMPQCAELVRDAVALLKEQGTANLYKCPNCGTWVSAENVVWCKDCKHAGEDCEIAFHFGEKDDWFCADGKRKVGEGNENP